MTTATPSAAPPPPPSRPIPSPCPACGAYSLAPVAEATTLLAVCDVLVVKVLEVLGRRIVRSPRSRFQEIEATGVPWHRAHMLWMPDDELVELVLRGAWDVVPALLTAHGSCGLPPEAVARELDSYVHDLAVSGTPHTFEQLAERLEHRLGLARPHA